MNFKTYETLSIEIKENIDKRRVFEHLYNDAKLDDEKKYYKTKIDLIDEKIAAFLQCQDLLLKNV